MSATHAPTAADVANVAAHLECVIAEADPQRARALLRLLIEELRVNGRAEIQPTYGSSRTRFVQCPKSGAYRDRTGDLRLAKPALSQLS